MLTVEEPEGLVTVADIDTSTYAPLPLKVRDLFPLSQSPFVGEVTLNVVCPTPKAARIRHSETVTDRR